MPCYKAFAIVGLIAVLAGLGTKGIVIAGADSDWRRDAARIVERNLIDEVKSYTGGINGITVDGCHTVAQDVATMRKGFEADGTRYRDLGWSVKEQDGPVLVSYRFSLNGHVHTAQWRYDDIHVVLTPLNQDARLVVIHTLPCAGPQ